jgi:predicted MPP superfamily phosphohydrolase
MFIYISSGVGTAMLPFRLGTKAEVVAIEFK